jgi:hypothetical protein
VNAAHPHSSGLIRQVAAGIAALVLVQVVLLQGGHLLASPGSALAACIAFGLVAFAAWLVTGVRWPLVGWALAVLIIGIDATQVIQPGGRDAFGEFAEGATGPAPLLSAHAPDRARRQFRIENGD